VDEYLGEVQPSPPVPLPEFVEGGADVGQELLAALAANAAAVSLVEARKAELRTRSNAELLALVRLNGSALPPEELRFIHDLAIERLTAWDNPAAAGADELARLVMQVAVSRIA
jgi:hypothetical protein